MHFSMSYKNVRFEFSLMLELGWGSGMNSAGKCSLFSNPKLDRYAGDVPKADKTRMLTIDV